MAMSNDLKQNLVEILNTLPEDSLREVALFVDYMQYVQGRRPLQETPFTELAGPHAETRQQPEELSSVPSIESLATPLGEQAVIAGLIRQLMKVGSTMLYSVGYDEPTQMLEVVFYSGGIYRYYGVPKDIYEGLLAAPSVGRYMHANVIGVYPYERVWTGRGEEQRSR